MNSSGPIVAIAPFSLSIEEQELFSNSLMVRFQDISIVHFLKADYFKTLLEQRRLLLRRADTYPDDTEEATYPEVNRNKSSHADTQIEAVLPIRKDRDAHVDSQMIARSLSFIHCWYEGDPKSQHMWERYGDNSTGVCIQSTTHALQAAFGTPPVHLHCEVGRCTYWNASQALPEFVSSFPSFRKRKKFDDEQEIRLLARIKLEHTPTDSEGRIVLPAEYEPLPVDLRMLVRSVTFGSSLAPEKRQELSLMLKEILDPLQGSIPSPETNIEPGGRQPATRPESK
jgi:hypothetical protein